MRADSKFSLVSPAPCHHRRALTGKFSTRPPFWSHSIYSNVERHISEASDLSHSWREMTQDKKARPIPSCFETSLGLTNPRTLCGKVTVPPGVYSCVDPVLLLPGWGRTMSVRPTCTSRPSLPRAPQGTRSQHKARARGPRWPLIGSECSLHLGLGIPSPPPTPSDPGRIPRALTPAGQQVISKYPPPAGLHASVLGVPRGTTLPIPVLRDLYQEGGQLYNHRKHHDRVWPTGEEKHIRQRVPQG